MAQIIKIHDYISRYELDPYHYMNQFIRLKKERWKSLLKAADEQQNEKESQMSKAEEEPASKRKHFFLKRKKKK